MGIKMSGKSDFKKINDRWCGETEMNNRAALDEFYSEAAQNNPSTSKKKKVKAKAKKADHKHDWEKVIIKYDDWHWLCKGRRCKICGKLVCDRTMITIKTEEGHYRSLNEIEVKMHPDYKNLPLIEGGKIF